MPADQPDDLDKTFARIVAEYDAVPDRVDAVPWPAQEDVGPSQPRSPAQPLPQSTSETYETATSWESVRDDEEHFVPPTPPPVPRPEPLTLMAWLGVLGAPIGFVMAALVGMVLPRLLTGALIIGFVAGIIVLIARMSRHAGDGYDPDDGAVV